MGVNIVAASQKVTSMNGPIELVQRPSLLRLESTVGMEVSEGIIEAIILAERPCSSLVSRRLCEIVSFTALVEQRTLPH